MSVQLKTTQYGLSVKAGGWDPDGDSSTDQWQGDHGNTLNTSSCALTASARALLNLPAHSGKLIRITFPGSNVVLYRTHDDTAPESDPRLDIFNPWSFDAYIPDFGLAEVVA